MMANQMEVLMGFHFNKSFKIFKGVWLNIGSHGISISFGKGKGLSYTKRLFSRRKERK
ncbi:DUF4236 domain-containing protein [Brevibacillus daliensis]|uniref:DUF4236 domain-containing protein n=1 Tax=Brevibacillus daliensis TaxID=2892995 RepID=UPI0035A09840